MVIRRHVLRNALLPTIAVVAVQIGYLVGGLVVVEVLFNYQGIGSLSTGARQKDFRSSRRASSSSASPTSSSTLSPTSSTPSLNPRIRIGGVE